MPADLYTVLGVSRTDSDEAIRRAYKKLAMKWHPDRNSAPDAKAKFQDISRAYDVLGDASKRKIYDQYGEDGLRAAAAGHDPSAYAYAHDSGDEGSGSSSGMGAGGWQRGGTSSFSSQDAEELFRRFFGGGGGVRGGSGGGPSVFTFSSGGGSGGGQPHFFQQQQQQQPKRGRTFSTGGGPFGGAGVGGAGGFYHPFGGMDNGMNVDSDDSDDGASAFFPHQRQYQQQSHPQQPQQPKSVVVTHKLPCTLEELASGFQRMFKISRKVQDAATGQVRADTNVLTVNGLPGWKAGTKITFADAGDQIVGAPRQDVQFVVEEKEHPRFKRVGDNLETEVVVPLVHALCGGAHLQVKSLGGDMLSLPSLPRVTPETTHTFPGQGMPRRDGSRGDLVVRFKVAFPDLSEAQKAAVRKVLPTS